MSILDCAVQQREAPDESPMTLLGIALAAFLAFWVVTPVTYQIVTGRELVPKANATSQSTSQPASDATPKLAPRDLVALSIASPICGLIVLTAGNLMTRTRPFERIGLTRRHLTHGGIKWGLIWILIVLPLMFGVLIATEHLWNLIHFDHPKEHDMLRVLGGESSSAARGAIIVSAIVLAPVFEEFYFRGMFQSAFRMMLTARFRWLAILMTSLAFTVVHGAIWLAPPIFVLSICLGYAYERTRNLWVPILIHAAFNAASLTVFLMQKT